MAATQTRLRNLGTLMKLENNNPVKYEACCAEEEDDEEEDEGHQDCHHRMHRLDPVVMEATEPEDLSISGSCESGCQVKCDQCDKDRQMAASETDKDSGILIDDKLEIDTEVYFFLNHIFYEIN